MFGWGISIYAFQICQVIVLVFLSFHSWNLAKDAFLLVVCSPSGMMDLMIQGYSTFAATGAGVFGGLVATADFCSIVYYYLPHHLLGRKIGTIFQTGQVLQHPKGMGNGRGGHFMFFAVSIFDVSLGVTRGAVSHLNPRLVIITALVISALRNLVIGSLTGSLAKHYPPLMQYLHAIGIIIFALSVLPIIYKKTMLLVHLSRRHHTKPRTQVIVDVKSPAA